MRFKLRWHSNNNKVLVHVHATKHLCAARVCVQMLAACNTFQEMLRFAHRAPHSATTIVLVTCNIATKEHANTVDWVVIASHVGVDWRWRRLWCCINACEHIYTHTHIRRRHTRICRIYFSRHKKCCRRCWQRHHMHVSALMMYSLLKLKHRQCSICGMLTPLPLKSAFLTPMPSQDC